MHCIIAADAKAVLDIAPVQLPSALASSCPARASFLRRVFRFQDGEFETAYSAVGAEVK
jgi:hypothetical protein